MGADVEFDFEKLKAYQRAEEFVDWSEDVIRSRLRRRRHLADQLHRASTSITFNIAEGAGESSPAEKIHFYRIACRSAMECVSITRVLRRTGVIEEAQALAGRALLKQVVSLVVAMCRSIEARPAAKPSRPIIRKEDKGLPCP